jgi:hypothetical protein
MRTLLIGKMLVNKLLLAHRLVVLLVAVPERSLVHWLALLEACLMMPENR